MSIYHKSSLAVAFRSALKAVWPSCWLSLSLDGLLKAAIKWDAENSFSSPEEGTHIDKGTCVPLKIWG